MKKRLHRNFFFTIIPILVSLILLFYVYKLQGNSVLFKFIVIILLIYSIFFVMIIEKYILLNCVLRAAEKLGFKYYVKFSQQPRIKGIYKNMPIQIHYRYKIGGRYEGKDRTYVKLKLEKRYEIDSAKFDQFKKGVPFQILSIRYIIRSKKQYLLMKVAGYVTEPARLRLLMDRII
ncbi:MAG: hypothetical protein KKF44_06825 [Nanoarchaeota archaeon]|nr:hypothetical protein [Nanoarchaeota archaeon]